jgi:protein ImuB
VAHTTHIEERGVVGIALRVTDSEALSSDQLALFNRASKAPEALLLTLDRLRTRLGDASVLQAKIVSHVLPSKAVAWRAADGNFEDAEESERDERQRPLSLYTKPLPATLHWPDQGRPEWFEIQGARHLIRASRGPERIEGGWWESKTSVRRDYYIVETTDGARWWLYQELNGGAWFVQGAFD